MISGLRRLVASKLCWSIEVSVQQEPDQGGHFVGGGLGRKGPVYLAASLPTA
jgi:hypothetical protein